MLQIEFVCMIMITRIKEYLFRRKDKERFMKTQKITQQPNFNGKLVLMRCKTYVKKDLPQMDKKLKEITNLIQDKPYDVYISKNKLNPDFYNISANTSYNEANRIKEYSVKVKSNVITESIVDAVKDAMDMYEKFIAKDIKR